MKEHEQLIQSYCTEIKNYFKDRLYSICLFGSIARGDYDKRSDIDLLVIVKDLPFDIGRRIEDTNWIHLNLKKTDAYKNLRMKGFCTLISDIFFTPEEVEKNPPILLDIVGDGILLYDKNNFLASVLQKLDRKLKELGSKRIKTDKGYYWILKPDLKPGEVIEI
jgi:hypothetical protein